MSLRVAAAEITFASAVELLLVAEVRGLIGTSVLLLQFPPFFSSLFLLVPLPSMFPLHSEEVFF